MPRIQGVPDLGPGLRLHLNENTGGCSPRVVEAVRAFDGRGLATYPDYRAAVMDTAAFLHVKPDWLLLTNGLDEGVLLTSLACLGATTAGTTGEVVMAMPAFDTYVTAARAVGARIVSVPPEKNFAFPAEGMIEAIGANTRLVYINNPNNPTGQPVTREQIRRIARAASHALIFLDEAYHDFLGENFLAEAVAHHPNILVGRTFSKAHGLAGIRVGVLIGRPEVLEPIRTITPLFNLNVVAVAALRAALTDTTFTPWYVAQVEQSKRLLYEALDRCHLRYWKSAANFVLVDGGPAARALVDGLIARGVLVRDRSHDPYSPDCFRITAGVVEHTQQAVEALEALCAKR
jgi:histidinol-phosphate aminotransferase